MNKTVSNMTRFTRNLACTSLFVLSALLPFNAHAESLVITSKPIPAFKPGSNETKFSKLEFLGGIILSSRHREFGGLSAIRFLSDNRFIVITDTARVITGELTRKGTKPVGLKNTRITRLKNSQGKTITGAIDKDSEALAIINDKIFVSFERNDRIIQTTLKNNMLIADKGQSLDLNSQSFPSNRGIEAMAAQPETGDLFAFAENARDEAGNHRGFVINNGKIIRKISVLTREGFYLTDAAFLDNGDLLLLERYYNPFTTIYMRIRRIKAASLSKDEPLDGEILINVNGIFEIDNMESLAVSKMKDGSTRLTLVSDDNFEDNQRNLLLEFKLLD